MDLLRFYWRSLRHLNHRGYIYVWANLFWIGLSLPIITAPAAWAGLIVLTHRSHTQLQVSVSDLWDGFKQHFWPALLNGIITLLIVLINVTNLLSYDAVGWLGLFFKALWIAALLVWFGVQIYLWPIMEELENPSLWSAYRNAFLMVLRQPFFTLGLLPVIGFWLLLGFVLPPLLLLLSGSMIAILSVSAALRNLERAGYHNPDHHVFFKERD